MSDTPSPDPIIVEIRDNAVIARVNLKLFDDRSLKAMNQMIDRVANPGVSVVVLDLSRVQIVPSLSLGALVQLSNKCKARGQRLKLAALQPQVRQTITVTQLNRILDLVESVDAAIE